MSSITPGFLVTASIFSLVAPPLVPFLNWDIIASQPENDRVQTQKQQREALGSFGMGRLLFLKTKLTHRQLALGGRQSRVWGFRTKHGARTGQYGCPDSLWADARWQTQVEVPLECGRTE